MSDISIHAAIQNYLDAIGEARSERTVNTYRFALQAFERLLKDREIDLEKTSTADLSEDSIKWFIKSLGKKTPATEALYLQAVVNFFMFVAAEEYASPNLPRIRQSIHLRKRQQGERLPQFPREDIERVLEYVIALPPSPTEVERLRDLRDCAFLLILADTGLRVHEACKLRRADLDWNEGRANVIGKGNKQAVVRFSKRALKALKAYLNARGKLDGATGRPLSALPLFARHDKGAGKRVTAITTATGRNIVDERVRQALGDDAEGRITPHSFRHYFVTTVLRASGNLKLAQSLARHSNVNTTSRYAHMSDTELDKSYFEIFDDVVVNRDNTLQ